MLDLHLGIPFPRTRVILLHSYGGQGPSNSQHLGEHLPNALRQCLGHSGRRLQQRPGHRRNAPHHRLAFEKQLQKKLGYECNLYGEEVDVWAVGCILY